MFYKLINYLLSQGFSRTEIDVFITNGDFSLGETGGQYEMLFWNAELLGEEPTIEFLNTLSETIGQLVYTGNVKKVYTKLDLRGAPRVIPRISRVERRYGTRSK
jgi:hypothetical protein